MGTTTALRRELKTRFSPHAVEHGFTVDDRTQPAATTFRRRVEDRVHIFEVRWDKYGTPRFAVHFGTCPGEGLRVNGKVVPAEEAFPSWCAEFGSLRPRRGLMGRWWFRQDATWLQRLLGRPALRDPSEVVGELLALFAELERYWEGGEIGPHLEVWQRDDSGSKVRRRR